MNHLINDEQNKFSWKYDLLNCKIKTRNLNRKNKIGLTVLFMLNENEECFLIDNSPAQHFTFEACSSINVVELFWNKTC